MLGTWHNAFGFSCLSLSNTFVQLSLTAGPTLKAIGLGSSLAMGDMNISLAGAIGVDSGAQPVAYLQASGRARCRNRRRRFISRYLTLGEEETEEETRLILLTLHFSFRSAD